MSKELLEDFFSKTSRERMKSDSIKFLEDSQCYAQGIAK